MAKAGQKPRSAPRTRATPARPKPARAGAMLRRVDYGLPIDSFFTKQPPHLRAILAALRKLVTEAAPDATASIKWGMPFFEVDGVMMCALGAHKAHVNLILAGPAGAFDDPDGRLAGAGKSGRHLKLRSVDELPARAVRGWLQTTSRIARGKARAAD